MTCSARPILSHTAHGTSLERMLRLDMRAQEAAKRRGWRLEHGRWAEDACLFREAQRGIRKRNAPAGSRRPRLAGGSERRGDEF